MKVYVVLEQWPAGEAYERGKTDILGVYATDKEAKYRLDTTEHYLDYSNCGVMRWIEEHVIGYPKGLTNDEANSVDTGEFSDQEIATMPIDISPQTQT